MVPATGIPVIRHRIIKRCSVESAIPVHARGEVYYCVPGDFFLAAAGLTHGSGISVGTGQEKNCRSLLPYHAIGFWPYWRTGSATLFLPLVWRNPETGWIPLRSFKRRSFRGLRLLWTGRKQKNDPSTGSTCTRRPGEGVHQKNRWLCLKKYVIVVMYSNSAVRCFLEDQSFIRRGGAPSGAVAYIILGGMGVSTPIILSERIRFSWGNHSDTWCSRGFAPVLGRPRSDKCCITCF